MFKDDSWYVEGFQRETYYTNPYSAPEKYKLTIVKEFDTIGGYEYDIAILWKHENGTFWYASDSGCSCGSPFESYGDFDDLREVRSMTDLENALKDDAPYGVKAIHVIDMLRAAREAGLR